MRAFHFTPGPWNPERRRVTASPPFASVSAIPPMNDGNIPIASLMIAWLHDNQISAAQLREVAANSRLIAAAPAMLDFLLQLEETVLPMTPGNTPHHGYAHAMTQFMARVEKLYRTLGPLLDAIEGKEPPPSVPPS